MNFSIGHKILNHLREVDNLVEGRYQPFVSCEIDPSNRCQLDCKWCFFKKFRKKERVNLDMGTYSAAIVSLYGAGCKSVTFTGGGEPLVHPEIKEMIDFAFTHHMKVGLITNGIYLHKIFDDLHKFTFVRVSLDCADRENYAYLKGADFFDQVCENISVATKMGCHVGISMVHLPTEGKEKVERFMELGKSLGVDYAQVKASWQLRDIEQQTSMMYHPEAFVTERYTVIPELQTMGSALPCKIAGLCGNIAADGKLYYCCVHRGDPNFEVWNLNVPFALKDIINRRAETRVDVSKCGSCRYANFAEVYREVADKKFIMLRHREFI